MKLTQTLLSAAILITATSAAQATLMTADSGNTVYDTDLNIYWLADANYAKTNSFGVSGINSLGRMNWLTAQSWIAAMNAAKYLGYNDWRLPTTTDTGTSGCDNSNNGTDCGYNSTGSEMSHLYYNEFGNKGYFNTEGTAQSGYGLFDDPTNLNDESLFTNLQSDYYWSGTEYALNPDGAWVFNPKYGFQTAGYKPNDFYALAVRPGQVAAVPEPGTMLLLGIGLLDLIVVGQRRLALR